MSVYITGMEMPSCCGECRFLDECGDYPLCIITDEQRGYNFRIRELRMPHCPLIPIPPHGRLIDADAVDTTYSDPEVIETLETAPTIIPADKETPE